MDNHRSLYLTPVIKLLLFGLRLLLIIILPFMILIRGAVFAHEQYDLPAIFSIGFGFFGTSIILIVYITWIYRKVTGKVGGLRSMRRRWFFISLVLMSYCIHALFFMSSANMKSPAIQKEVRDLHPLLRLSISTLVILDPSLIMTDASRMPEDYKKMNLPTPTASLHFKQKDGYAYAVDLRTNGRSTFRNAMLRFYFHIMGFKTLRHVGTADHLHVSLHCKYRPRAK